MKKKTLTGLAIGLTLAVLPLIQPHPARAILGVGDICANCSEEVGEVLRQAETMAQWVTEFEKLEQQIQIMEQNLKQLPDFLKNNPIEGLKKLAGLTSEAVTLRADQNAMIQIINELYPDQSMFAQLAGATDAEIEAANATYQENYDTWSSKLNTGILATFQVTGRQLKEMTENGEMETYIDNLLKTPEGQEQALEAANELAAMQLQDSMKTRELIAAMAQGQAYQAAKAEKVDEMNQAKWKEAMKTDKLENRERETGKAY